MVHTSKFFVISVAFRTLQQAGDAPGFTGLWFAGNEGMEKKMEATIIGYVGTTIRIHFFIQS